jgi:predicted XRE-type DNA-binding protein
MGLEEAILEEVKQKGIEQGQLQKTVAAARNMLKRGKLSIEEIAEYLEVTVAFVQQVAKGDIQ